ncbi:membrane protein [Clostridium botulinum B str. Osaka05]|uniref:Membrane protein n=1 Tax=Clostridium botulinum B str. Osaka05 TaxID=1407017 RepID=A0A0S6U3A9_CLOBO|nr:DUF4491 family protein [Clostridium botulinum]GAE01320.1 membrane protein [Clostridium botulinum B str. Osaka05]
MNFTGIIMGVFMLFFTGIGHVIVIKGEYHFGIKIWPGFLILGIGLIVLSLIIDNVYLSGGLGIGGLTFLWGILELFQQKERVKKGWFPKKQKIKK